MTGYKCLPWCAIKSSSPKTFFSASSVMEAVGVILRLWLWGEGVLSSDIQNQAFIIAYAIENDLFLYSAQWTKIIYFTEKNDVGAHLLCLFCFQTDKRQVWWMTHGCLKKLLTRTILWFPTPELHPVPCNMASPHTSKDILPKKWFFPLKYSYKDNFLVSAGYSLLVQITFAVGINVMPPFHFSWPAITSFLKQSALWVCSIKPCLMSTVDVLEAWVW